MPNLQLTELGFRVNGIDYVYDIVDPVARAAVAANGRRIICWNGKGEPVVADIPLGVVVTYNGTTYTGTMTVDAANEKNVYCVHAADPDMLDIYDEYVIVVNTKTDPETKSWDRVGNTRIDLSGLGNLAWADMVTLIKGNGTLVLGKDTTFTASAPSITVNKTKKGLKAKATGTAVGADGTASAITGLGTPSSDNFLKGVSKSTKKMVKDTVPNVTGARKIPEMAIESQNAACGVGKRVILKMQDSSVDTVTFGTAKEFATGALSENGTGATVVDDVSNGSSGSALTGLGTPSSETVLKGVKVTSQPTVTIEEKAEDAGDVNVLIDASATASAPNIAVGTNNIEKVPRYDDLDVTVDNEFNEAWYGVEKDTTVNNTKITRIGAPNLHRSLPIQSGMRRCVINDAGVVQYYLHQTDSRYKENGELAVLDGTDGQVMVEIPLHYLKIEISSTKQRVKLSQHKLPGFTMIPKRYISAWEASLDRTNLKLSSVINTTAQYRGGNNTSSWDSTYRSLLGMPATDISLNDFREYARNRGTGWIDNDVNVYVSICMLYIVEYANTNCQSAYNSALDDDGYHQGGLGSGVSEMPDWADHNSYNPVAPCGVTVTLGNATGVVTHNVMSSDGNTVKYAAPVPSYRGIENLFGHVWKHTDGILVNIQSETAGGESQVYVCKDIDKYSSSITSDYTFVGNEARSSGWTKNVIFPYMIASELEANSSTGWADYHYTNIPSSGSAVRCVLFGGSAVSGSNAGFAFAYSHSAPSRASSDVGSRLCFTPATS